jgi:translocator protein
MCGGDGMNFPKLAWSIFICLLAGAIGSIFTAETIPTWYAALNKPSFNPPNWIFGPVWTTLYIMMGISLYIIWQSEEENRPAMTMFFFQLALNSLWSVIFFGFHAPLAAFICIVFLWLSIAATIYLAYRISRTAGLLLVPYIMWVSFASILNLFIWKLN